MQNKMEAFKNFTTQKQPFNVMKSKAHIDLFWNSDNKGSKAGSIWEEWLREKGLIRGDDDLEASNKKEANGWTTNSDLSDMEDDAQSVGGMRRPGEKDSEGYTTEEAMGDDWDTDSDNDDNGGEMMPLPSM